MLPITFGQNDIIHTVTGLPTARHKAEIVVADYQGLFDFGKPSFPALDAVYMPGVGYRFNLRNLFQNYAGFNLPLPNYNQMLPESVSGNIVRAKVRVQSVGTAQKYEDVSTVIAIINGGLSERDFSNIGNQFFERWAMSKGPFLTWQPKQKRIEPQSPEYLYWLQNINVADTNITVRYSIKYIQTNSTIVNTLIVDKTVLVSAYKMACIPCNPSVVATFNTLFTNIISFTVQVIGPQYLSEIRSFFLKTSDNLPVSVATDTPVFFKVLNSFGVWDTIRFYGKITEATETERYTVDYERRKTLLDVEGYDTISVNTGDLDQDWLKYMKQLLYARRIYQQHPKGYREVILEIKSLKTIETMSQSENATLDFRYVEQNSNYSNL
jgi:hypothetical protein